jgi:superfamily II DNA or RNA helicase
VRVEMPEVQLWPHQTAAISAAVQAVKRKRKRGLWSICTGAGKTWGFLSFAKELEWRRNLILVNRDELVRQTVDAAQEVWPQATVGVIQQDRNEFDRQLVVASVQSLHASRLRKLPRDMFDLVIPDECHHGMAESWEAIFGHFQSRFRLGVTATPERTDGKGLDKWFGAEPLFTYPIRQGIEDGVLVRIRQYGIQTHVRLDDVSSSGGDFAPESLSRAVNTEENHKVVGEAYLEHAKGRRALSFCVDLEHVYDQTEKLNQMGIRASFVDGSMSMTERRSRLQAFREHRYDVMANCGVLIEGFDDRGVSCILAARPTKSRPLYTQMVGRGLRRYLEEGKQDCIILDFVANHKRHKLVTISDLLGARGEIDDCEGRDVLESVDESNRQLFEQQQIDSLWPLDWTSKEVMPWPAVPGLEGYVYNAAWHEKDSTTGQRRALGSFGVKPDRDLTRGEAAYLLNRCMELEAKYPTPCTNSQKWFLKYRGVDASRYTKREAGKLIAHIKRGGDPHAFDPTRSVKAQRKASPRSKPKTEMSPQMSLVEVGNAAIWGRQK